MRGPSALLALLLLAPLAAAEPYDCTGTGAPTDLSLVALTCDERAWGENRTRTTTLVVDLDGVAGRLVVQHFHTVGPDESARCTVDYYAESGAHVRYGTGCAGVRSGLLP